MPQFDSRVIFNRPVAPSWMELGLTWDDGAPAPEPGQFVTIRQAQGFDPLLRRPFAVASYSPKSPPSQATSGPVISLLYQVRGLATTRLSELGSGAVLDVLGPLGRAFSLPRPGEATILAAGGVGLGPILFLAHRLEALEGSRPVFLAGFRTADAIPDLAFPHAAILCTDDGSAGYRGTALNWISHNAQKSGTVLRACGPAPMLAALARLARERAWEAELSAEQWMACGVGACMGCALPMPGGAAYLRACADGPVFGRDEIDWEAGL